MSNQVDLSIVIPVYNGEGTLPALIDEISATFAGERFEIVLVNDGSTDDSARVCLMLQGNYPGAICFVDLARNFGEHEAVLAGLGRTAGAWVGILDDDGQNPPGELRRIWQHACKSQADVVYGRYRSKQHSVMRNLGSWCADRASTLLIGKPRNLYFSSFKVLSRALVVEVLKYRGPFPYLDGLIYRATNRIEQVEVEHRSRKVGKSGYTLGKLLRLWLNICFGFSILPLRAICMGGAALFGLGILTLVVLGIDGTFIRPVPRIEVWCAIAFFFLLTGMQLIALGIVGEYLGRLWLHENGTPPFVIRSVYEREACGG